MGQESSVEVKIDQQANNMHRRNSTRNLKYTQYTNVQTDNAEPDQMEEFSRVAT